MPKITKKAKKAIKKTVEAKIKPEKVCKSSGCGCLRSKIMNASTEVKIAYLMIIILTTLMLLMCFTFRLTVGKTVERWVYKNPEAILNSVNKFVEEKQKEMMEERQKSASEGMKKRKSDIQDTKYSGVLNPKGPITIVEFFDYNCGYCKEASNVIGKVAKENKNVRVIFKELPILGEPSRYAAKVAIAVSIVAPNRYFYFHKALMEGNARTKEGVQMAVKKAGVKLSAIEKTLNSKDKEIETAINKNLELATAVGIGGTPALFVEDEFVPGFIDYETLKEMIAKIK